MNLKDTLKLFCLTPAPAGAEHELATVCREVMAPFGICKQDRRGNFICTKEGEGMHFLLDAHADQIGFAVTAIEEGGFLKLAAVGGIDRRVSASQEVLVLGKEPLFGVIGCKPPHLTDEKEKKKTPEADALFVDTGLTKERLETIVAIGDRVVFKPFFEEVIGGNVVATAVDDRAGMAIIARVMELLQENDSRSKVTAVFSVQEEVAGVGAANASYYTQADEAIAVDVSFAEQPEIAPARKTAVMPLNGGAFIGYAPILDREMSKAFVAIAQREKIPYRVEVMGGRTGTNADCIATAKYGTKTVTISPPIRNMHTPIEMVNLDSMEHCATLIARYILSKEGK